MPLIYFVTHPEVAMDPAVPVPEWGLSEVGRRRMAQFAQRPELRDVARVFSSRETKAVEAARILAAQIGRHVDERAALGENDRSATGFMPKPQFEAAADEFFAHPDASWRGWERACDAQARIVHAVEQILREGAGDTVIVSHGAVGTLYKCHLRKVPITRAEDQRSQGHFYCFEATTRALVHDWLPIAPP